MRGVFSPERTPSGKMAETPLHHPLMQKAAVPNESLDEARGAPHGRDGAAR
jgi:hypothetical protein